MSWCTQGRPRVRHADIRVRLQTENCLTEALLAIQNSEPAGVPQPQKCAFTSETQHTVPTNVKSIYPVNNMKSA